MGPLPPAAPEGVSATLPGGGQDVLVTWQASPDEGDPSVFDYYDVLRGRALLGLPVAVQDYAVTSVLSSVLPVLDSVSAYDPSDATDPWKTWNAAKPAKDLSVLSPSTGFWGTLSGGAEW